MKEEADCDPKFTAFKSYLEPHIEYRPVSEPAHCYTIEIHKALFTEELFEVYTRYEKAVHKKDRGKEDMKKFFCSSPVFDPINGDHDAIKNRMAPYDCTTIDEVREFKDEGIYPGLGSYHFYHRIDGKLVAVGNLDITKSIMNSQYFLYDPEYSFLCLGVVGAIHEIEFMRMVA